MNIIYLNGSGDFGDLVRIMAYGAAGTTNFELPMGAMRVYANDTVTKTDTRAKDRILRTTCGQPVSTNSRIVYAPPDNEYTVDVDCNIQMPWRALTPTPPTRSYPSKVYGVI